MPRKPCHKSDRIVTNFCRLEILDADIFFRVAIERK